MQSVSGEQHDRDVEGPPQNPNLVQTSLQTRSWTQWKQPSGRQSLQPEGPSRGWFHRGEEEEGFFKTAVFVKILFLGDLELLGRFGENAGEATEDVFATAGHAVGTAWNIFKIRQARLPPPPRPY